MRVVPNLVCDVLGFAALVGAIGCQGVAPDTHYYSGIDDVELGELAQPLVAANSCVCIADACGNGAIGGAKGEIDTGISTESVVSDYRPDLVGAKASGWACGTAGVYSCVCAAASCGNGVFGGVNGEVDTNVSITSVLTNYGPDRTGAQQTGWNCRLSEI